MKIKSVKKFDCSQPYYKVLLEESSYDDQGKVIAQHLFDGSGVLISRTEFRYNEQELLAQEITYGNTELDFHIEKYYYNEKGQLYLQKSIDQNGATSIQSIENKGNKEIRSIFDAQQQLIEKTVISYTQRGHTKELEVFDPLNRKIRYSHYHYNPLHQLEKRTIYNRQDELFQIHAFKYDIKGREVRSIIMDGDGELLEKVITDYDQKGNVLGLEILDAQLPCPKYSLRYLYNRNGQLIREIQQTEGQDLIYDKQFEYNSFGDLVAERTLSGGQMYQVMYGGSSVVGDLQVVESEIEYY